MSILEMFNLNGKTAIITGGGRGLGEQIAKGYAEAGANIVLCSRKVEACEETAGELETLGVKTLAIQCDVSNPDDIQRVVDETISRFGRIDILVNNSGASWGAPSFEMPLDAWNKVINVNLTGTFLMSQAVGKVMAEQGGGKIVNIASVAGLGGTHPDMMDTVGYNASKGAIITLTKDLAVKWGRHQINVNAIAPGFFPTKMSKVLIERGKDTLEYMTPLGRLGGEEDLKGVALFLASEAARYVTGQIIVVDGGKSAMI
ncbi:gluconate 5-dehydrogenase [Bacillus sp. FJAT-27916]|uniref:SDR family oxidoreductase n=1 Tax=Bacillaceae TaxID=186817 RepID=UPI000670BA4A|nr:SDR family oxidoreductase [Bacillus sp. FJAT-27916]KMY45676.1 gluconate 5-dehydrogenase [Bacillus sp. FJAT-27916]